MTDFPYPPVRSDTLKDPGKTLKPNEFSPNWVKWFSEVSKLFTFSGLAENYNDNLPGLTVVITTAALTGGGVQGSMTFQNGILVAQTQAT
jgi:hypothetical protein